MDEHSDWIGTAEAGFQALYRSVLDYLPQLAGALALFLAGWVLAAVLRVLARRGVRALGWMLPRLLPRTAGEASRGLLQPELAAGLVFWVVLLAFAAAAAQVLGLQVFADWLDALFSHLPRILLAALLLVAGVVAGKLVRQAVLGAAGAAGLEHRTLLSHAAQATVLAAAAVIALDIVGLDITVVVVLLAILVGALSGGAALAFGLGAQAVVGDMLGVRSARQRIRLDDAIRIDDLEGRVVEFARHAVIIETGDGRVSVPGRYFNDRPCTLLMREGSDE